MMTSTDIVTLKPFVVLYNDRQWIIRRDIPQSKWKRIIQREMFKRYVKNFVLEYLLSPFLWVVLLLLWAVFVTKFW